MHVIAKASRLLDEHEWFGRTAVTLEAIIDGYAVTRGDNLVIDDYEVRLWDEVQMNEPSINYSWSFFAPINLTTVLRFIREERFARNEHYYGFVKQLTEWILTNLDGSADLVGVRGSNTLSQTRVWSTASSVIVLSRVLARRYELAKLEQAVLNANRPGRQLAELIDLTVREAEAGAGGVARHVRLALNTVALIAACGAYPIFAGKVKSNWATIEGKAWLATTLLACVASIIGANVTTVRDRLVTGISRAVAVCRMTYRILSAVRQRGIRVG
jgi:hypothetical protein